MSITLSSASEHQRRCTALAASGLDPALPMVRAASYANEVWIGDEVVLRINFRGVGRLAREARIAQRLPAEARYPEILAVAHDDENEWMLTRRIPGIDLGRAWAGLAMAQRERAIRELADALAAVHATPCDDIPDDIRPPHTLPLAPLLELVDEIIAPHDPAIAQRATEWVLARWDAFDDADRGLVHGDPHLENVLWDGDHVSALLDLEWSRPSWIHADLEILLALADSPAEFAAPDREHAVVPGDYAAIPRWLRDTRPAWFTHPRLLERLEVLALSRVLGCFEDDPAGADSFGRWEQVASLLANEGSVRRVLASVVP